ncbi:MAG: hypothetical protein HUU02_03885 [Bacteroidetes bacterium]|nr:hypothetical protein [Bacteroidota bacterium]
MITPDIAAAAVREVLHTNRASIGIKDAEVLSEDTDSKPLRPPYAGVIADFEDESLQATDDTVQIDVPVEIKILCSSGEHKNASLAFQEAFGIAIKVITHAKTTLTTDDGEFTLMLRKRPFTIIRNAADQCVIQANLYYYIGAIGE